MSAPRNPNRVGEALMEWQRLLATPRPDPNRAMAFLLANPGWPQQDKLIQAIENSDISFSVPASAATYFDRFPPKSANGHLRHALALLAIGRQDQARDAARRAWTTGSLTQPEEQVFFARFPGLVSRADNDRRMDRLLWAGATLAAQRQLPTVSPDKQAYFATRLAFRLKSADAAIRASATEAADPALLRTDAGYIVDKATWLRQTGRSAEARSLLARDRGLSTPPVDVQEWMATLLVNAKGAAADGNWRTAYDIARRVDDALPSGQKMIDQNVDIRDDYTSLVWLAAESAYHKLHATRDAIPLYVRYANGGRSPVVQAKGYYWAGRASQDIGDRTAANAYFDKAASFYDSFYGQLALERLGRTQPRPGPMGAVSFSQAERNAYYNSAVYRAAQVLGEMGAHDNQTQFVRIIANNAKSRSDHYFASQLAKDIGRPDLAVMIGRSARINNIDDFGTISFPIVPVPDSARQNWTMVHAISRQESQFDKAIMSHAGARGLMQLMPGTAREQAGKMGLSYDPSALTTDTQYNIMLGSAYFERLLSFNGGSYPLAVAAYNAGQGNVNKWLRANGDPRSGDIDILDWIEAIPFTETRNYVQKVLENAVVYDSMNPNAPQHRNPLSHYLGKRNPG